MGGTINVMGSGKVARSIVIGLGMLEQGLTTGIVMQGLSSALQTFAKQSQAILLLLR